MIVRNVKYWSKSQVQDPPKQANIESYAIGHTLWANVIEPYDGICYSAFEASRDIWLMESTFHPEQQCPPIDMFT